MTSDADARPARHSRPSFSHGVAEKETRTVTPRPHSDTVEPVDSYQSYRDPAGPNSDDGDDVQHEHDTSSSYMVVDTANGNEAAELDATRSSR